MFLALVTGLVFGLVPALTVLRGNTNTVLKEDTRAGSAGKRTGFTRATLVIVETALALVLLVGAGLLIKSFARLQDVNPGFSSETCAHGNRAARHPISRRRRAPRVLDAAGRQVSARCPALTRSDSRRTCRSTVTSGPARTRLSATRRLRATRSRMGGRSSIGADYFRAMRIPILEGRAFNDADSPDSPPVVVIDQFLVKRYFADRSPIGQQIRRGGPRVRRSRSSASPARSTASTSASRSQRSALYYPVAQLPRAHGASS